MKKFSYRLERVLRFKEQIEQQKQLALADRNEILNREKEHLAELSAEEVRYLELYGSLFHGKIDIRGLKSAHSYVNKLKADKSAQSRQVVKAEKNTEEAKIEVRDSMRDRKKYDKLKERKHKEYDFELNKAEQKELDEIAARTRSTSPPN